MQFTGSPTHFDYNTFLANGQLRLFSPGSAVITPTTEVRFEVRNVGSESASVLIQLIPAYKGKIEGTDSKDSAQQISQTLIPGGVLIKTVKLSDAYKWIRMTSTSQVKVTISSHVALDELTFDNQH